MKHFVVLLWFYQLLKLVEMYAWLIWLRYIMDRDSCQDLEIFRKKCRIFTYRPTDQPYIFKSYDTNHFISSDSKCYIFLRKNRVGRTTRTMNFFGSRPIELVCGLYTDNTEAAVLALLKFSRRKTPSFWWYGIRII